MIVLRHIDANDFPTMEPTEEKKSLSQEQDATKPLNVTQKLYPEPESHLQSLGFTLNNGKARFKLDENALLYSKATVTNFCGVDADDTSLSFVVLGKDSLDTIQQSSLASYVDIQQKSMSIDYNSIIASWDSAEVHRKLNELLQENTKLKETLKQNNIAMKQQFNSLATWHEEIMRVHQDHKKKFAETRELINYLKKENADLKMRLSSELTSHTEMGYELLDANDKQNNTKGEKVSISENKLSKSIIAELDSILNEDIEEEKVQKQGATSESVQKIAELEKQIVDIKQLLEEERSALRKEQENLTIEKKLFDSRKKTLEIEYKNLNDAKELLQQERISLQEEQSSLDQQSLLYETHYKKALESEKKKFEVKCTELITELGIMHESLEKKEVTIKQLEKELMQHKEDISLLQTQLKFYEEDFRQERKLKELALEEKNALSEHLQKQIEFNEQSKISSERHRNSTEGLQHPPLPYSCPNCNLTCENLRLLEAHVNRCLSID